MAAHSNLGTLNSWMTAALGVLFYPALSDVRVCKAEFISVHVGDDRWTGTNGRHKLRPHRWAVERKSSQLADRHQLSNSLVPNHKTVTGKFWFSCGSGWLTRCLTASFENGQAFILRFGLINAGRDCKKYQCTFFFNVKLKAYFNVFFFLMIASIVIWTQARYK